MAPVDADVVFISEGRHSQVYARGPVIRGLRLREFDRPARIPILLGGLRGWSFHACGMRPALISSFSPSVLRCLGAATIDASMIWPPMARKPAFVSDAS